jgi:hypothetical protein
MTTTSSRSINTRPTGVSALAIINGIAFFLTLAFWGIVAFKKLVPFPSELSVMSERANAAVTWGFLLGDMLYSAPLLLLAAVGLWRLSALGWTAAQMANILWIYSMTVILLRDAYTVFSPGGLLFLPFPLISVWAIGYLWKRRSLFWQSDHGTLHRTS